MVERTLELNATLTTEVIPLFGASRIRIQRALKFIGELKEAHRQYEENEPLSAVIEFILPDFLLQPTFSWKGIGLNTGAIVGDCIHSLRVSLDLMASELARINQKNDKQVYFPFAESAAEFPKAIKSKNFNKCGQDAVDLLANFAPYKGGNERLRAIHDLDIRDKHTALVLTHAVMEFQIVHKITVTEPGVKQTVPVEVKDVQFIFPADTPLAGLPVIKTLEELVELIDGIIEAFARMIDLRSAQGVV